MAGRNWLVAAVAIILGLAAVIIANSWFSGMADQQAATQPDNRLVKIVVATQPLEYGTKLTVQNIRLQDWPAASIPQGAFRTIPDALKENRTALRPIVIGEPVLADKVSGKGGRAELAALLPEGMRAYPIPIDAGEGVAGFVLPGSMVDVLLTRKIPGAGTDNEDLRSDVLLSGVQVLAIDQQAQNPEGKPSVGRNATVVVSLYDAQRLALAKKMGTLSLVLRKVETAAGSAASDPDAPVQTAASTVIGRQITAPPIRIVRRETGGGGGGGGSGRASAPTFAFAPTPPAPRTGPALPSILPGGSTMTVFRGSEPTVYPVGMSGGR